MQQKFVEINSIDLVVFDFVVDVSVLLIKSQNQFRQVGQVLVINP